MSQSPPRDRVEKRLSALERLRLQRGSPRRTSKNLENTGDFFANSLEPFVRRRETDDLTTGARVPVAEITEFLQDTRKKRRKQKSTVTEEVPAGKPAPGLQDTWQDFLGQAGAHQITDTFSRWLGGVSPEFGVSSTPLEELIRLREEIRFRKKALEALLKFTRNELDELDSQIHVKESSPHGCA